MGKPAKDIAATIATVEILTFVGNIVTSEIIPHTFLKVTDVNGNTYHVGFGPQQTGLVGPGKIFDNTDNPVTNTSGPISLMPDQGATLQKYIIGIGPPITEEPSHTTWHTDRYRGGSADQSRLIPR